MQSVQLDWYETKEEVLSQKFLQLKKITISARSSQNSRFFSIVPKIEHFLMKCDGFAAYFEKTEFLSSVDLFLKKSAIFAKK